MFNPPLFRPYLNVSKEAARGGLSSIGMKATKTQPAIKTEK